VNSSSDRKNQKMKQKHIEQANTFLHWLKNNGGSVETTRLYISKEFFCNNKEISAKIINRLKEEGLVENSRSYSKGRGQRWCLKKENWCLEEIFQVTVSDRVLSDRVSSDRVSSDRVSSDRVSSDRVSSDRVSSDRVSSDREFQFNYKNIEQVTVKISEQHKQFAKEAFEMLEDKFSEHYFKEHLRLLGLDKYQQEFLYQKVLEKRIKTI
jgi:hypothetical protein